MSDRILDGLHCLIADDDPVFLQILEAMLRDLGLAKVTRTRNGSELLTAIANSPRAVDVILCDVWMPDGNGLQVLKAIRTGQVKSVRLDMCFIMISAIPVPASIRAAASLDACGFLAKPFTLDKLRSAIVNGRRKHFPLTPERYALVAVPGERSVIFVERP